MNARVIANNIYHTVQKSEKNTFFIASSDFSHFLSPKLGAELDDLVLEKIYKMNTPGVEQQVNNKNISVCGYGPIMSLMEYSKLHTPNPKLTMLKRGHSGEVYPADEVVNYVSMIFSE